MNVKPVVPPDKVIKAICDFYSVTAEELEGSSRVSHLVYARQVVMYVLRTRLGLTQPRIGWLLGNRDHSTVFHGVRHVEVRLPKDERLKSEIEFIHKMIDEISTPKTRCFCEKCKAEITEPQQIPA